jgi:hypothetical protein
MKKLNWQIWAGFVLSLVAGFSYPFVFTRWPITRDFPWANLILFAIAMVLLFLGLRRAFKPDKRENYLKNLQLVGGSAWTFNAGRPSFCGPRLRPLGACIGWSASDWTEGARLYPH